MILLRMYCSEGSYGVFCLNHCEVPPEFDPDHVMCETGRFYCRPGWTGLNCELKDPCTMDGLRLCQNDAKCIPTYTSGLGPGDTATFRCACVPGWVGPLCSIPDLRMCQHDNNTVGTYSPWKYQWADDERDLAISYGKFS
ncbi:unnamed protein product [Echinostoma caproni]|uniref:EGF-like domain-containing protein n=1 Tax=Echinostoma caproni TaxID=27848 RepID=A0A183B4F4_9TREM|nr:unnamed protein product [Echinostoma caproni]